MRRELKDIFLLLVRLGIGHDNLDANLNGNVDWIALKALAERQGLSAVVLDGIDKVSLHSAKSLSLQLKLQWIGEVLQNFEARYSEYEKSISSLAGWYNRHGFRMMVLKGYACAMNWPNPKHRPCGDIDIWQFGDYRKADAKLVSEKDIKVDTSHHHHTVFEWQGFSVENHFDFLNVYHHRSNREMEVILKELGGDDSNSVIVCGEKVYLPSANLHALFLLRHSMSNFASAGFQFRQLLDWGFFVEKHGKEIDWEWLEGQVVHFGMKKLFDIFNAICVEDLGFNVKLFPQMTSVHDLKNRVLNDILAPEFSDKETGGFFSRAVLKLRRWRANAWKHELCFSESMWSAFWSGVWNHLLKPSSI